MQAGHAGHNIHYPDPLCSTCFPDTVTRTVDFGLDIEGKTFEVSVAIWSDGMTTTSANYDHENYDPLQPLLIMHTGPTILQITEAIDEARQAAWEYEQERTQG